MNLKKRILVAPLNWGLGHATRCIPIFNALITQGFEPIIASDGNALLLLQKEFPNLESIELPSYNINYSKKGSHLKLKLLINTSRILKAIKAENQMTQQLVETHKIEGVISDNRFGVYCKKIPSVYITHQLNVLSGSTTTLTTMLHKKAINNFDECWVPDYEGTENLSGQLGHSETSRTTLKYIGPLSRFRKTDVEIKYNLMVLLSGPEPQRTILETKLILELKDYKGNVVFVKGIIEAEQKVTTQNNLTIYNYMTSVALEKTINESELVLSRSGYTTIMDLAKMEKKAFFIPTPGQYEQLYLAKKFKKEKIAPYGLQGNFNIENLNDFNQFKGFSNRKSGTNYQELFSLFERE